LVRLAVLLPSVRRRARMGLRSLLPRRGIAVRIDDLIRSLAQRSGQLAISARPGRHTRQRHDHQRRGLLMRCHFPFFDPSPLGFGQHVMIFIQPRPDAWIKPYFNSSTYGDFPLSKSSKTVTPNFSKAQLAIAQRRAASKGSHLGATEKTSGPAKAERAWSQLIGAPQKK
jgi:hypothetical protein